MAPAKINLILKVLDRRKDGYHNVWSLMHAVELEDELHFRTHERNAFSLDVPSGDLPSDHRNLVSRAAALVWERRTPAAGVSIALHKRIPVGAGLGGGSSDAAATLLGLNHLLETAWPLDDLVAMGAGLGSDVPFFFLAPTAIVEGRGEIVRPVVLRGQRWFVLVYPGFSIQTGLAYARLTETRTSIGKVPIHLDGLMDQGHITWETMLPLLENDFEEALMPVYPELGRIKHALLCAGAEQALLSGSGSTVFGVFARPDAAYQARDRLATQRSDWRVFVAGSGSGLRVVPSAASQE